MHWHGQNKGILMYTKMSCKWAGLQNVSDLISNKGREFGSVYHGWIQFNHVPKMNSHYLFQSIRRLLDLNAGSRRRPTCSTPWPCEPWHACTCVRYRVGLLGTCTPIGAWIWGARVDHHCNENEIDTRLGMWCHWNVWLCRMMCNRMTSFNWKKEMQVWKMYVK